MTRTVIKVDVVDTLKEIEHELMQEVEKHEKEIADFQQEINKAEADANKAQQAVLDAKNGDDPKAYTDAVAEQRTANDIVEYYSGKIEELKSKPVITEEQYNDYSKRIKDELDQLNKQSKSKMHELLADLSAIEPVLSININKGNELLNQLQHKLYKDDASMATPSGSRVRMEHLENRYKEYKLIQNIELLINQADAMGIFK